VNDFYHFFEELKHRLNK